MQAPKSAVKSLSHFDCSKQLSHPLQSYNFVCSTLTTNALRNWKEQVGEVLTCCHPSSAVKKQKEINNPVDVVRKGAQTLALTLSWPRHKAQQHSPFTTSSLHTQSMSEAAPALSRVMDSSFLCTGSLRKWKSGFSIFWGKPRLDGEKSWSQAVQIDLGVNYLYPSKSCRNVSKCPLNSSHIPVLAEPQASLDPGVLQLKDLDCYRSKERNQSTLHICISISIFVLSAEEKSNLFEPILIWIF